MPNLCKKKQKMKRFIIAALILFSSCQKNSYCPDCLEQNCIYQEINNNVKGEGTDDDILKSIQEVCRKRCIEDSSTIKMIESNYYL